MKELVFNFKIYEVVKFSFFLTLPKKKISIFISNYPQQRFTYFSQNFTCPPDLLDNSKSIKIAILFILNLKK